MITDLKNEYSLQKCGQANVLPISLNNLGNAPKLSDQSAGLQLSTKRINYDAYNPRTCLQNIYFFFAQSAIQVKAK